MLFPCLLICAWLISFPSTRDFQGISYCFVMPFSLVKVSISVSCLAFIVILDINNDITALYKTTSSQVIYTDFYIIIFAISELLLIRQNLQHPYLSYFIPCHRLPLRSPHWPSRDQKGILYIHPIICLRRIPGPARLVGFPFSFCFSLFVTALLLLCPFYGPFCRLFVGVSPTLLPSSLATSQICAMV